MEFVELTRFADLLKKSSRTDGYALKIIKSQIISPELAKKFLSQDIEAAEVSDENRPKFEAALGAKLSDRHVGLLFTQDSIIVGELTDLSDSGALFAHVYLEMRPTR